jgi:hypothetical protein
MADENNGNGRQVVVIPKRTLKENEQRIREGVFGAGESLLEIRDARQYVDAGYKTFEDYCQEVWGYQRRHAYRLIDSAKVVALLETSGVKVLPQNERQVRALSALPPDEQVEAWQEASSGGKATGAAVERAVQKRKPAKKKEKPVKMSGWTKEMLKDDEELSAAFAKLEKLWGKSDAEAIRKGVVEKITRKDVIALVKLSRETLEKIQGLVMGNHWTPASAISFLDQMPDEDSTVEDLINHCIATKGKYETFEINGYHISVKYVGKRSR